MRWGSSEPRRSDKGSGTRGRQCGSFRRTSHMASMMACGDWRREGNTAFSRAIRGVTLAGGREEGQPSTTAREQQRPGKL